jgi:hypothetical protein
MKNLLIVIVLIVLGWLVYRALNMKPSPDPQRPRPRDTIQRAVDSGRDVGRNTGKAYDAVRFPGSD